MRLLLLIALFGLVATPAAQGKPGWWPEAVDGALERAGSNRKAWLDALQRVPEAHRVGFAFLLAHMPEHDLKELQPDLALENTALAYRARAQAPWGDRIPEDIFLNDVLPYANVSESRDPWRRDFHARFSPLVADCKTPGEAAQRLNERVFKILSVRYSTKRRRADQSPRESIEQGVASCTGLSIVLTNACRAVGVPARLAGIPRWPNKRGNHTWVEVWDGSWHFTGACEPSAKGLNHTWFQRDAALADKSSRMHSIYAVSYRRTGVEFPMVWSRTGPRSYAVNVTDRYAPAKKVATVPTSRVLVRVVAGGNRVAVPVLIADADDAEKTWRGTSKDESADTNDILSFDVPRDRSYLVTAVDGDRRREARATTNRSQVTVTIDLRREPDRLTTEQREAARRECVAYFGASREERDHWPSTNPLDALLVEHDAEVRGIAWRAYRRTGNAAMRADFDAGRVRTEHRESPYTVKTVGEKPANGWPLFIAMHGGGGTAKRVNDSQWRHMQRYYRDQPGVKGYLYVALRAPNDRWDGFYDEQISPLVVRLIRQLTMFGDVDADKVFAMGYSHGGYGAFVIGPRVPHRFAAVHASAAAPTGGRTAAPNLRNTVFTYMIGARDTRYGRAERCQAFAREIAALRGDRTDIYPVTMEWHANHGHGGLPDKDKIASMYAATRNPTPRELTWHLTDSILRDFFWLHVDQPKNGARVDAKCAENTITISAVETNGLRLCLDARLVDLSRPITLRSGDDAREVELAPSLRTLNDSLIERGDPGLAYTVAIDA